MVEICSGVLGYPRIGRRRELKWALERFWSQSDEGELRHVAGSRALKAIADVLRKEVRETDLPIRYGGDEFVVLLPHTTLAEGLAFATRALAHIAEIKPGGIPVTVSIGIASLGTKASAGTAAGATMSDDDLLRRADAAAYRAKRLGGNRVCADGDDSQPG